MALRIAYAKNIPPELLDLVTGCPVDRSEFEGHLLRHIIRILDMEPPMLETSLQLTRQQHWETLMKIVAKTWVKQGRAEGIA